MDPVHVSVDHHDLLVALSTEAGSNALITLDWGDDSMLTMPKVIERHPFRSLFRHVDFVTVSLTEKVRADVNVQFVGEAEGVKEGGILSTAQNTVSIQALPTEIPTAIELDVSALGVGDSLRVADLPQIEGVEYLDDPDSVLASVTLPRAEVEEVEEVEELEEVEGEVPAEAEEGAEEAEDTE